jgi:starch phosphorylase
MKAALNGVLHFSILDGWWVEGYHENCGFKIGNGEEFASLEQQNAHDSEALYTVLEREIIPQFYDRKGTSIPTTWIRKMKGSIHMAGQRFSAQRMLMDYANHFYVNGLELGDRLKQQNHQPVRDLSGWLGSIEQSWDGLKIESIDLQDQVTTTHVDHPVPVQLRLRLGALNPNDVRVEIVSGRLTSQEELADFSAAQATLVGPDSEPGVFLYRGEIRSRETGRIGLSARISPQHPLLVHNRRPRLITWW